MALYVEYKCGKPRDINFTEDIIMAFFANLINNIYAFVIGILKNAGVVVDELPETLIPEVE